MTYWVSFYVAEVRGDGCWWVTGSTFTEPVHYSVCGVVTAESPEDAIAKGRASLEQPDAPVRFCDPKPDGWRPDPGRFPPREEA
jgi:hypothetical protein